MFLMEKREKVGNEGGRMKTLPTKGTVAVGERGIAPRSKQPALEVRSTACAAHFLERRFTGEALGGFGEVADPFEGGAPELQ